MSAIGSGSFINFFFFILKNRINLNKCDWIYNRCINLNRFYACCEVKNGVENAWHCMILLFNIHLLVRHIEMGLTNDAYESGAAIDCARIGIVTDEHSDVRRNEIDAEYG